MPVPDVEPLHEMQVLQLLECPVDACSPDRVVARVQLRLDLHGAQRAVLLPEQLDDGAAGAALAEAALAKCRERMLDPVPAFGFRAHRAASAEGRVAGLAIAASRKTPTRAAATDAPAAVPA